MNRITNYSDDDEAGAIRKGGKEVKPTTLVGSRAARWLALGAVAGPVLFTLAWFILGFLSPGFTIFGTLVTPYSPIIHPVSGLGLGVTAPFMNAAFVLGGLLLLAGVVGVFFSIPEPSPVTRWICIALLASSGLGMVISGIFTLESPLPHLAGFLLGTGTPVVGFLVVGLVFRRIPRWHRFGNWLLLGSPLTLVLLFLTFATFGSLQSGDQTGIAGLTQRVLILEVHAWFVALGWLAYRGG